MNAAPSIVALLARVPQLAEYTVAPPALPRLPQMRSIERELRASIAASPDDARAHAMLGNVLTRRSLYLQARASFRRAIELDPAFADAHLAAAELSSILRDEEAARSYLHEALGIRRRFDDPLPTANRRAVLMLLQDAPYAANTPLEVIIDREHVALHKLYIGEEPREALPDHDVLFVAFGAVDDVAMTCATRIARTEANVINRPEFLKRCARESLSTTLEGITGVRGVSSQTVHSDAMSGIELPSVVRPVRTHAGYGLTLVQTPAELGAHMQRFPASAYDVSRFVDYRSADGYFRKYRIMIVDGTAYPYHLAISPRWIVHYQSSPMEEHAWMREEEQAFLMEPACVFPQWDAISTSVARAVGLDYFGLDVARLPDGTMLVFEADPAMLVHDEERGGVFSYKRGAVNAIRSALHRLIEKRGAREDARQ